jgi:hypothetical protein
MQKVINVLSILSFVGVAGIIGGGAYVYTQRDALIENAKEKIASGALPGMLDAAMPELPGTTGGAIPEAVGENIPGF